MQLLFCLRTVCHTTSHAHLYLCSAVMELTNKTFDFRFLEHRVAAFQFRGIREARYADVAPTTRKQNS